MDIIKHRETRVNSQNTRIGSKNVYTKMQTRIHTHTHTHTHTHLAAELVA